MKIELIDDDGTLLAQILGVEGYDLAEAGERVDLWLQMKAAVQAAQDAAAAAELAQEKLL